jgi:hypothetical protein
VDDNDDEFYELSSHNDENNNQNSDQNENIGDEVEQNDPNFDENSVSDTADNAEKQVDGDHEREIMRYEGQI